MNNDALNYNPLANTQQVSELDLSNPCIDVVYGCMYIDALNYNNQATIDDGSCILNIPGCPDSVAVNYNEFATLDNGTCFYVELIPGCMNEDACNYDSNANVSDGSCEACLFGCNDTTCNQL